MSPLASNHVQHFTAAGTGRPSKLAVVTSHPIQYHAHWFRALAANQLIDLEVLYGHRATSREQADAGFGVEFDWDIDLLDGYAFRFLKNASSAPSVMTFAGVDTPEIGNVLSSEGYDAVLVNGWHYKAAWQAIRACWKRGIPVMVRSDSNLCTPRHPVKKFLKQLPYQWFIRRMDACLAVGQWSAEYFYSYGAPDQRVFLVPHTVSCPSEVQMRSLLKFRPQFRRQWGLEATDVVFAFVGKLVDKKRPLDFIEAIGKARQIGARVSGLMAGDGPLRERCQELVRDLQIPIHFAGFVNQSAIHEVYVASDALVLPSDGGETWGLVVNEAMSWGRPCWVSDRVGCGPDLVLPGESGGIFPMGDVDALASQMADAALHPPMLAVLGEGAKARVARYSIDSAVHGVLEALSYLGNR